MKRIFTAYLSSFIFFFNYPGCSEAGKEALSKVIESYHFVRLEQTIARSGKAVKVMKNTRDRAIAYFYMAASYIALGQKKKGRRAFQQAIRTAPKETPDPREFSPKIILAFKKAKETMPGGLQIRVNKRIKMKQGKTVSLSTIPEGAEIMINDKSKGRAPLTVPVRKNQMVKITAFLKGYRKTVLPLKNPKRKKIEIPLIRETAFATYEKGMAVEKSVDSLLFKLRKQGTAGLAPRLEQLFDQSLSLYTKAANEDQKFSLAYAAMGRIYLKKIQNEALRGGAGSASGQEYLVKARNFSEKALELDNDKVAFSLALQNIGNCFLNEGDQNTALEERVGSYKKGIEKFDEAIATLKEAEYSLDYKSRYVSDTSHSRATAFEKIALTAPAADSEMINDVCTAWEDFYFYEEYISGEVAGLAAALHREATEKMKKYCRK